MPCCGRAFHPECLLDWLSEDHRNTCPNCRTKLFEDSEDIGIGPGQEGEGEGETGDIWEYNAVLLGEESWRNDDAGWRPEDMEDCDNAEPSDQDNEDILERLRSGRRHEWGELGDRDQYRLFLLDGADLPALDPGSTGLTVEQDLALFRELQRRGCFELEGMRRMYWDQRFWGHFRTYEHLMEKATY